MTAEFQKLADAYQMDIAKVRELVPAEELSSDVKKRKAAAVIADSAVAVAPKAE